VPSAPHPSAPVGALPVILEDQLTAPADEQGVQPIHLAVLLRLEQTLRDVLRLRRRKCAGRNRQPHAEQGQLMPSIEDAHAALPVVRRAAADRRR